MKVAVIFGGISTEHDVSVVSGTSVIKNLNKRKYDIIPIYIDKKGQWYKYIKDVNKIDILQIEEEPNELERIENIIEVLEDIDVIFPVLHGLGGEDGTIQGLFKMINKPFVGCGVLASSVGMDKVYAKMIFEKANILQTKYIYIRKEKDNYKYISEDLDEEKLELKEICERIEKELKYPMFVKPSNSGSSVGINKVENIEELKNAIVYAAKYDNKIIIEQGIIGTEVECAVLGNEEIIASSVGEIIPADKFYSFDAKYNNAESKVIIPANINNELSEKIRSIAKKAFRAIDGKEFARVDFFIEKETNDIYLNEINTIPGFTQISMYPKLMENIGIKYEELLDKLIELALE